MSAERISSMGELVCQCTLEKTATGFVPGQHRARILDPGSKRDLADLGASLTYVDDEGMACLVMCMRYRDGGWRSYMLKRAGLRRSEQSTIAAPELTGDLLAVVEEAAEGVEPFPFEEPSDDEQAMRRLAHKLWDHVAARREREGQS